MAGSRRRSGKPLLVVAKPERRLNNLNLKLAATSDPFERLAAAVDFYRGALAWNTDAASSERMVERLKEEGERLYASTRGDAR